MGFFSWKTQDTDKSIANRYSVRPTFTVYMVNPLNLDEYYKEDNYEGYGEFGGKDYYKLLAEINNAGSSRNEGIKLAFHHTEPIEYPILVEDLAKASEVTGEPKNCKYQGYFYCDDEDYISNLDDEDYID